MEKVIIEMMERASAMTLEEMEEVFEEAKRDDYPFRYLMKEVFQNELNKRNGVRHISLEKVKQIYQEKLAALK